MNLKEKNNRKAWKEGRNIIIKTKEKVLKAYRIVSLEEW